MKNIMSAMHKIIYIAKTHHSVIESKTKGIDMHRSMHVMLSHIAERQTPPSQKEIAVELKISAAAVAATLERLEADGYIEKVPLDTDRRTNRVKATEKGISALKTTCEIFTETDKKTFEGFDDGEIGVLCEYLDRIANNLTDIKGDGVAEGDGK